MLIMLAKVYIKYLIIIIYLPSVDSEDFFWEREKKRFEKV